MILSCAANYSTKTHWVGLIRLDYLTHSNTGQTFVSLAEELLSGGDQEGSQRAVEYLTKAMDYFGHAMVLQTEQLELIGSLDTKMDTEEDGRADPLDSGEMDVTGEGDAKNIHIHPVEQWVVIKEPVTKVELVDTITAQLETLTVFCGVVQSTLDSSQFTYIKERGQELIVKLEALLEDVPQCKAEASLPQANFNISLADLKFKLEIISAREYTKLVQEAFPSAPADSLGPVMLVNSAEAYIQLAQALSDHTHRTTVDILLPEVLSYLTLAAKFLAEAAKEDKTNARLFCLRGDVEMWRSQNIFRNEGYQNRMAAMETLWGNAGVYYRGAKRLAEAYPNAQQDIRLEGAVKEIIIGIQQNLSRGDGGFSEIVATAKRDLEQLPGWDTVAIDAARHGIFDEIIPVELGK